MIHRVLLPEVVMPERRLGRHVMHDPASLSYGAPMARSIKTVRHERRVPIFDQGNLGSCVGNAAAGLMCTGPFGKEDLTETDAVALYSEATHFDSDPGVYPPTDTGTSGLAVMKALRARGWIRHYDHAFGLNHVLRALTLRPGILGITWLDGCDNPDPDGVITYAGDVRGGHEVEMVGLDTTTNLVWFANSWGVDWGLDGYFAMSFDDLGAALADYGDATFAEPNHA